MTQDVIFAIDGQVATLKLNRPHKLNAIAAVNGYAFGGGLETALACDIRIASTNARFAAPEIKLGWIGGGGMTVHLAHSVGMSNAALMMMTGDPIDAQTAFAWSLVSEIVAAETLQSRAREIADVIASRSCDAGSQGGGIRARPANDLLRHRRCAGRPRGVPGKAGTVVRKALSRFGDKPPLVVKGA
jgi:enoyl-CoA hydratase/carnithine racemase